MLLVCAVTLAATPASRVSLPRGISLVLPAGWHMTTARLNGVRDPVTVSASAKASCAGLVAIPLHRGRSEVDELGA
jgi:hypothetical protein